MSANTRIVVLRRKELIYTALIAAACLLLLLLLLLSSSPKEDPTPVAPKPSGYQTTESQTTESQAAQLRPTEPQATASQTTESQAVDSDQLIRESSNLYIPGIYTTQLVLGDQHVEVEVIVDHSAITSLKLNGLSRETVEMYPLLQSTFNAIRDHIREKQSLDTVTYESYNKYTSMVLVEAIRSSLQKAEAE